MLKKLICILFIMMFIFNGTYLSIKSENNEELKNDNNFIEWNKKDSLPTKSGNYCISNDINLNTIQYIKNNENINICLHGHTITQNLFNSPIYVLSDNAVLSIYDFKASDDLENNYISGKLCGGKDSCIKLLDDNNENKHTTLNLYSGTICDNSTIENGGAIFLDGHSTFNMYGGLIKNNESLKCGGAVYAEDFSKVNLYGGLFKDNISNLDAGAVYLYTGSTGYVNNCTFLNNTSTYDGGAIYLEAVDTTLTIDSGIFKYNTARSGGGAIGVFTHGTLFLNDADIEENNATHGGGIWVRKAYCTINNCEIINNKASESGGGIQAEGIDIPFQKTCLTLNDATIENNEAPNGGGLYLGGTGKIYINGGIIKNNHAFNNGGGICNGTLGYSNISNVCIDANVADNNGGGIYCSRGSKTFINTIDVIKNKSVDGAGIYIDDNCDITNINVFENEAINGTGGIKIAKASYDGESYYSTNVKIDGDIQVHDNNGLHNDMYIDDGCIVNGTASGFGEKTLIKLEINGKTLPKMLMANYNYEKNGNIYTITQGNAYPYSYTNNTLRYIILGIILIILLAILLLYKKTRKKVLTIILLISMTSLSLLENNKFIIADDVDDTNSDDIVVIEEDENVDYSNINEFEKIDGVYKIHSIEGLKNIYNHLDENFELLCNIDLNGEKWKPIGTIDKPFTGSLSCDEHKISNFTIDETTDGNLGFFGVNEGTVTKLFLENVQIISNDSVSNIGLYAGINKGTFNRCEGFGTLICDNITNNSYVGGVCGINYNNIKNTIGSLNININNSLNMTIGGIVGLSQNGSIKDSQTNGNFIIKNNENKVLGLLAGDIRNCDFKRNCFIGENNTVNNEYFDTAIGKQSNSKTGTLLIRQNNIADISKEARELRNEVVDYMYQLGSILWTVDTQIQTSCVSSCSAQVCHTALNPGTIYRGMPYKHSSGTLDRIEYCLDDDNILKKWVTDLGNVGGFQTYFGSACYSSINLAWTRVSNTANAACAMEALLYGEDTGVVPVGNWANTWQYKIDDQYSQICIEKCGIDAILEDYALVRAGDAFIKLNTNGAHAIMAATDVIVVRDENGKIDPDHSYLYTHEQGGPNNAPNGIVSSWCLNRYKAFSTLLGEGYLPVAVQELLDGKKEDNSIQIKEDLNGILGLTTGIIYTNHFIDSVTVNINENDKEILNKKVYCRIENLLDYNGNVATFDRNEVKEYDLSLLSRTIQNVNFNKNKRYHCSLTVNLNNGYSEVIKEFDF